MALQIFQIVLYTFFQQPISLGHLDNQVHQSILLLDYLDLLALRLWGKWMALRNVSAIAYIYRQQPYDQDHKIQYL